MQKITAHVWLRIVLVSFKKCESNITDATAVPSLDTQSHRTYHYLMQILGTQNSPLCCLQSLSTEQKGARIHGPRPCIRAFCEAMALTSRMSGPPSSQLNLKVGCRFTTNDSKPKLKHFAQLSMFRLYRLLANHFLLVKLHLCLQR